MRAEARHLFEEMVRDCGPGIVRMESSCDMYLGQYLADFPDERQLLATALAYGAPEAIAEFDQPTGYAEHLNTLTERFARRAELDPAAAGWAIQAWAAALGRPGDAELPTAAAFEKVYPDAGPARGQAFATGAMLAIVGGGACVGGFLAMMLIPIFLWAADFESLLVSDLDAQQQGYGGKQTADERQAKMFLGFAVLAVGSGLLGGAAAVGAWQFAGGDCNPWATASVACGTAFTMVFIATFVPLIILPFKPVVYFGSIFAAVYKSAARGGEY